VIGAVLVALFAFGLATAAQGFAPASYDTVTIGVGDTVWGVAAQRYPAADTREKVDEILRANGMSSPQVYPGEVLRVPAA
jgi:LysM repeat protein